jgi:hypothetical protein
MRKHLKTKGTPAAKAAGVKAAPAAKAADLAFGYGAGESLPALGQTNPWLAVSTAMDKYIGSSGMSFMKFQKDGQWVVGIEADIVPRGTKAIAQVEDTEIGWRKWVDNSPVDKVMGRIADGFVPPARAELDDNDRAFWEQDDNGKSVDPWKPWAAIPLKICDSRESYLWESGSRGGLGAIYRTVKVYGRRMQAVAGKEHPGQLLIELQADKYKHSNSTYGWIWVPVLQTVGWIGPNGKLLPES